MIGDYLRYSRFQGIELKEPLWAIVTEITPDQGRATILLTGSADYRGGSFTFLAAQRDRANFTTLPEQDVPDEVFVALAKRALLGTS